MSLRAMLWALDDAPVEAAGAKVVLWALADQADDDGRNAWPSIARLVNRTGLSESTVRRYLHELERNGVIRRGDQLAVSRIPANRRPVVYDLALECSRRGVMLTPQPDPWGVNEAAPGVSSEPARGVTADTQTVLEPTTEPPTPRASLPAADADGLAAPAGAAGEEIDQVLDDDQLAALAAAALDARSAAGLPMACWTTSRVVAACHRALETDSRPRHLLGTALMLAACAPDSRHPARLNASGANFWELAGMECARIAADARHERERERARAYFDDLRSQPRQPSRVEALDDLDAELADSLRADARAMLADECGCDPLLVPDRLVDVRAWQLHTDNLPADAGDATRGVA